MIDNKSAIMLGSYQREFEYHHSKQLQTTDEGFYIPKLIQIKLIFRLLHHHVYFSISAEDSSGTPILDAATAHQGI